jgi:prolyl 4-hydroxylase
MTFVVVVFAVCDSRHAAFVQCWLCLPQVKPKKGDALLFWTFKPDGSRDEQSLHGACPVVRGTKWVITRWIHSRPYHPSSRR